MAAQVRRLVTQCGFRSRAICRALAVFRMETPRQTNGPNYSQLLAQL